MLEGNFVIKKIRGCSFGYKLSSGKWEENRIHKLNQPLTVPTEILGQNLGSLERKNHNIH